MSARYKPTIMSISSLGGLYEQKLVKIAQQKQLSDEMSQLLAKLNESSRLNRRNLSAAISVSSQAGYFDYYVAPDDVKQAESEKRLNKLAKLIQQSHQELERLNEEIAAATAKNKKNMETIELKNISEWVSMYNDDAFAKYGINNRPEARKHIEELGTKFEPSKKIYGGTRHHRSFKSSSLVMKSGRLL